jgi:hypothetical protein
MDKEIEKLQGGTDLFEPNLLDNYRFGVKFGHQVIKEDALKNAG